MAKEKVTLTLDAANLAALRSLVGARSLSATVDAAIAAHLARVKHFAAVDQWLEGAEKDHGPVPPETIEWAARLVDGWAGKRGRRKKSTSMAGQSGTRCERCGMPGRFYRRALPAYAIAEALGTPP